MKAPQCWAKLFLIFVFGIFLGVSRAERTKKASSAALSRIKELINRRAEREVAQADVGDIQNDDANVVLRNPDAKPHHDELSVNDPEQYFQGDVELSEKQAEGLQEELQEELEDPSESRKKRKVGKEPLYKRWERGRPISYDFAENIPELTKIKIRDALKIWEQHTCIRFREDGPDVDRLEFFDGGGCSSFVGRAGGTQGISISTPGCDFVGIISHEVGHALGLFHEQARPDQQDYIAIHYGNIPISRWNNFHPVTGSQADTFLLPYDAGSVMHYGPYGFASDPYRPTISTLDRSLQSTIGQRAGPSFLDFEAINIAYNCLDKCPHLPCQHGGYPNPNDCSRCECPSGFSGRFCQEVRFSNCGAKILASTEPITISSPNFPDFFSSNSYCVWLIEAPPGGYVFLEFIEQFHYQCEDTCDKSYVEVHIGPDFRSTGYRYCCASIPTQKFASITQEMLVIHNGWGDRGRGFKARVWSDKAWITTLLPPITTSKAVTTTTEVSTTTTTKKKPKMTEGMTTTEPPESFIIKTTKRVWRPKTVRPTTSTAETPTTTEPQPLVPIIPVAPIVPVKGDECNCGPWSIWQDACTQQCGGCGKRTRRRQCTSTENCRTEDKRPCNFEACPPGTNFLFNNGEFHILWKGCCVGLFRSQTGQCTALDEGDNPFLKIISSLLTPQDLKKNGTLSIPDAKFIIAVKTTKNNHETRIKDIVETWFQLSPGEIFFVTDFADDALNKSTQGHLIDSYCPMGHKASALVCKMNRQLRLFVETNAKWSCLMDDDNFVNVPLLKDILLAMDESKPFYLGKKSTAEPVTIYDGSGTTRPFDFGTGGAGICLSQAAIQKMAPRLANNGFRTLGSRFRLTDDLALGFFMTNVLGIQLTEMKNFHSHLEDLSSIPLRELKFQPVLSGGSLGDYNNNNLVSLPYLFEPDKDPLKFRSLYCYIFRTNCPRNAEVMLYQLEQPKFWRI